MTSRFLMVSSVSTGRGVAAESEWSTFERSNSKMEECKLLLPVCQGQGSIQVEQRECFLRLTRDGRKAPTKVSFHLPGCVFCCCCLPVTSPKALFVRLKHSFFTGNLIVVQPSGALTPLKHRFPPTPSAHQ